ncbi:MAG: hypothetical protein FRX49_05748 [Trebouxia sp. A1-2]|nr:MAG: hypothetical protein FRX49_05748 [Trebouxia sp. A1-2]
MALADLPDDALRAVLQRLGPQELCRCKSVCRKLALMASEDRLWDLLCQSWFRRHGEHSGLCNATPRSLCAQLSKSSFATLYQMLHLLGGWPEGLWYRVDPSGQPRGALVWIHLEGSMLCVSRLNYLAEQVGTYCRILLDKQPVQVIIGASDDDHFSLPVTALRVNSRAGTLVVQFPHTESSTAPIIWHDSQGSHKVTGIVQWMRHLTMNQRHSLFGAWHHEDDTLPLTPHPLRLSRIVPLPSALPHPTQALSPLPAGFSAAAALGRLPASPGLWTAWYGAHGPEIVHVWFEKSLLKHSSVTAHEEPDHLPRPRLVGCKVTGDPNVPANQWTFEAQAADMLVKFNGLPTLVDMREREVQARFCCQGRINHDPADYKPEWVPAQLITYEGPKPMFSVLFDDLQERFRHIMDFEPVPLPYSPSLSWLHTEPCCQA